LASSWGGSWGSSWAASWGRSATVSAEASGGIWKFAHLGRADRFAKRQVAKAVQKQVERRYDYAFPVPVPRIQKTAREPLAVEIPNVELRKIAAQYEVPIRIRGTAKFSPAVLLAVTNITARGRALTPLRQRHIPGRASFITSVALASSGLQASGGTSVSAVARIATVVGYADVSLSAHGAASTQAQTQVATAGSGLSARGRAKVQVHPNAADAAVRVSGNGKVAEDDIAALLLLAAA
jgi:hypothetical protein